jgi:hypothetical protein
VVGERHPELLVQLVAVVFVSLAEKGDDVAECFHESSELALGELAARCRPPELALERLAFAFDFGDPFDDRGDLAVGLVEGVAVPREASVAVRDLFPGGGVTCLGFGVGLVLAVESLDGAIDVFVELLVEEPVEAVDDD